VIVMTLLVVVVVIVVVVFAAVFRLLQTMTAIEEGLTLT
jgi:hypothetical protein